MATVLFNDILLTAARKLKDRRSDPTPSGDTEDGNEHRYSSALLAGYVNRAVRDLMNDAVKNLGLDRTVELFPEFLTESAPLTLATGASEASVQIPADAWYVTDVGKSDYSLRLLPIPTARIGAAKTGSDPLIIPTTTQPYWWQAEREIHVLPKTATIDVVARYLRVHQDVTPSVDTAGAGDFLNSGTPGFIKATNTLSGGTYNAGFTPADVGKTIFFRDSFPRVYRGIIAARVSSTSVVLTGDGLPSADVSPIIEVLKADVETPGDLALNASWSGEIIDRAVRMGLQDAQAGSV